MTQYVCSVCGYGSASWYGKCPECKEWNTLKKFFDAPRKSGGRKNNLGEFKSATFAPLDSASSISSQRLKTGVHEFDRVLGGGGVPGEVILMAGAPGVGKSTLLLKVLSQLRIVYISGEESAQQVKHRAERIGVNTASIHFSSDSEVGGLISALESNRDSFDMVVIDSIQTVYSSTIDSSMGSVSQIKESAVRFVEFAKNSGKILIIVGHITKDGDIAGPKTLEHLVDCVVYLEGEKQSHFRILRAHKNRFGPTDEVGIFEMRETGLEQVEKPSTLIDVSTADEVGRSLVTSIEGSRALFYEIQTLVVPTSLAIPRRVVTGVDMNRLQLLLAVMHRHMGVKLDTYDVYVNVVGGLTAKTPGADLGIVAALLSSATNKAISSDTAFIGEIGLLGEIRNVYGQDKVIADTKRFGLRKIYSSHDVTSVKRLKGVIVM